MNARTVFATSILTLSLPSLVLAQGVVHAEAVRGGCADTIHDANTGTCLEAAVDAGIGQLFPLSQELYLNPFTRFVGMRTTNPQTPLHVADARPGSGLTSVFVQNFVESGTGILAVSSDDAAGTSNFGVRGFAGAHNGSGVAGFNRSSSFVTACGVSGSTAGGGAGVSGVGESPDDDNGGVHGTTYSDGLGRGVWGIHFSNLGTGAGVDGLTYSTEGSAVGVRGQVWPTSPGAFSSGVRGINRGTGGLGMGVHGVQNGSGWGVLGEALGAGSGVRGYAPSPGYGIFSEGNLGCTGVKSFVQPHPADPAREIRFVCLEGNESGTYFRGSGRIENGLAQIDVPEEFRLASESTSLTVQLTGLGRGELWIESKGLDVITVAGERDIEFDYFVNGVRRGLDGFEPIQDNVSFVPRLRGEPYRAPQHVRDLLVENGTLNADHTPNEATAQRMGWILAERAQEPGEAQLPSVVRAE